MKLENFKSKRLRATSVALMLSILLPTSAISSFADSEVTGAGEFISSDNIIPDCESDEANFSEDKVLIQLADTSKTEGMEFYALYSDDYASINNHVSELNATNEYNAVKVAESTDTINSELNLGVEFSEMKLLNPSINKSENGLYSIDSNSNDCNNIFSLTLKNITVGEALEILNDNPAIEIAEPNYLYELYSTPNDPEYSKQYSFSNINAPAAWNYTTGSSDVVVGIIDSGIDGEHPDLVDNLWDNPYYVSGIGCTKCSYSYDYHGYNFTGIGSSTGKPCGGTPTDMLGHGTHVAGIVGAKGNNGRGISGVNWNVKLAWLGIHEGGKSISVEAAIEALNYANNHNILITNNSYGGGTYSSIFKKAISDYKGLFVAAAGNETRNNNVTHSYPSDYDCPNIISVASTDKNNNRSDFSNYGSTTVHVAAPGSDIYSTIPGGNYDYKSGTSMASPCVAGIAALIKAKNPGFNAQQIKAAICGTVQSQGKTYNVIYDGGIVNAYAAVGTTSSSLKSVTFNYNYSGAPTSFVDYVVSGKKVREPNMYPERTGYIFNGWYTTASGSTLFNFNNTITSNTTIYAQWTPIVTGTYGEKFPDYKFRNKVISTLNAKDGATRTVNSTVSASDITLMSSIQSLNISSMGIRDITGLNYFTGLTSLDCSVNEIKYLDLSKLALLKSINCSNNILTSLNLSNLSALESLNCNNNLLSTLSLSSLTSLKVFYCYHNLLTSLNVNSLTQLQTIDCSYNNIKTIYNSSLTNLKDFNCSHNILTSLSISGLSQLQYLNCSYNKLTTLTTGSGLTELYCNNNNLTKLNVSGSKNLNKIICNSNYLRVINVLNLPKLEHIDVSKNEMNNRNDVIGYKYWGIWLYTNIFSPQNKWNNNPFTDVKEDEYYYKAIDYVYNKNFMEGTFPTRFEPTYTLSRGQLATIIYRMAGSPSVSGLSNPFTDVSSSSSYLNAIKWAYNNGNQTIMGGTSSKIFEPDTTVTRETAAVALDRYATRKNITLKKIRTYSAFEDDGQSASWARASIIKLYEAGIIDGADGNYFYPTDKIKRGDAAIIFRKFDVIRLYL